VVPQGETLFARTLGYTSNLNHVRIFFKINKGTGRLFFSFQNRTPSQQSHYLVITPQSSPSIIENNGKELFFGFYADTELNFTSSYEEAQIPSAGINGLSLLFYLIVFFMCFFGLLFVLTLVIRIRQFMRLRSALFFHFSTNENENEN